METKALVSFNQFFYKRTVSYFVVATILYGISHYLLKSKWAVVPMQLVGFVLCYKYLDYFFTKIYFPTFFTKTKKIPSGFLQQAKYYFVTLFLVFWFAMCFSVSVSDGFSGKINSEGEISFILIMLILGGVIALVNIFLSAHNKNYVSGKPVNWEET